VPDAVLGSVSEVGQCFSWTGLPVVDVEDSTSPSSGSSVVSNDWLAASDETEHEDSMTSLAAETIQHWWKDILRKRHWSSIDSAWQIQAWWRGVWSRRKFCSLRSAVILLQRAVRHHKARRNLCKALAERLRVRYYRAAVCLQRVWRGVALRQQRALEVESLRRFRSRLWYNTYINHVSSVSAAARLHLARQPSGLRMNSPRQSPRTSLASPPASPQSGFRSSSHQRRQFSHSPRLGSTSMPLHTGMSSSSTVLVHSVSRSPQQPMRRRASGPFTDARYLSTDVDLLLAGLLHGGLLSRSAHSAKPAISSVSLELEEVKALATSMLPGVHIRSVMRVHCARSVLTAFEAVQESLGPERLLWHGTSWDTVANISRHGFNRAYAYGSEARHGSRLGRGCYFAESPKRAIRFCGRVEGRKAVFLAGVLPGKYTRGKDGLIEPPVADAIGNRYDSTVDDEETPKVFCVFKDFQAVPLYLLDVA